MTHLDGGDHILCGWRVRASLPMPELPAWSGDDRPVDIAISIESIPKRADKPIFVLPHSQLWADGAFLLELDQIGRFWVEGGNRVSIEPASCANEEELRGFILGSVLGVLCHQRGLLPIHASAVRLDGRALLIAGNSGAGKSTLAAALGARGHALISDDVVAFDPLSCQILPAFPQRKLACDVMEKLGLAHAGLIPNRPGQPKFRIPAPAEFSTAPLAPSVIYILHNAPSDRSADITQPPAVASMQLLHQMIYRRGAGTKIQSAQAIFRAIAALVNTAKVHSMASGCNQPLASLDDFAHQVEIHARSLHQQI